MKKTAVLLMVCGVLVLTGCQSKEEKQVKKEKEEFQLLYEYEEDKVRPVVMKEKTPEELLEDIVMEELGMETDTDSYKERGVLKGQGIFVESAIREGSEIPQVSAIPLDKRNEKESNDVASEEKKKKEFDELMAQRRKLLESQYENDAKDKKALLSELEKRLERQEKRGKPGEVIGVPEKEKAEESIWSK